MHCITRLWSLLCQILPSCRIRQFIPNQPAIWLAVMIKEEFDLSQGHLLDIMPIYPLCSLVYTRFCGI